MHYEFLPFSLLPLSFPLSLFLSLTLSCALSLSLSLASIFSNPYPPHLAYESQCFIMGREIYHFNLISINKIISLLLYVTAANSILLSWSETLQTWCTCSNGLMCCSRIHQLFRAAQAYAAACKET